MGDHDVEGFDGFVLILGVIGRNELQRVQA
jgi:hypothetical protein